METSTTELKQKFMTGELLLLKCEPLGPAVEALQSAPHLLDAAVFGNALHLVVREPATAIPDIRAFLSTRGVMVNSIESIRPSLEDVFVSLTTERNAAREETN